MNDLEKDALKYAAEELAYRRSEQYKIDQADDKARRAEADRKAGHSSLCSLTKCHPTCTR